MKKIFLLSKENIGLASAEIRNLSGKKGILSEDLLMIDSDAYEDRLGYTHSVYEHIFTSSLKSLDSDINRYDWNKVYEKNICVRAHGKSLSEKEIAKTIWNKIKNPKANLSSPKTKIEFFEQEKKIVCGKLISDIDKSFLKRKAHMRPSMHPTSLSPKLARACINLTGIKEGLLIDPFCGSGGILIEAGLMGFKIIGTDIDPEQIQRSNKNLKHYGIRDYYIKTMDALTLDKKGECIVTDLPYGRASKAGELVPLYSMFLKHSLDMVPRMVVIFPDFIEHKKIIRKSPWKIKEEFRIYVHKSLSRTVTSLVKKN